MPEKPDDSKEMQREILLELQRITDRLDVITNYEERKPSEMYYVGCFLAIVLFVLASFGNPAPPIVYVGVLFLMIIMFCLTWKSRRLSPATQAWDRDQDRKLAERIKRDNGETKESVPGLQRNIHPPF